MKNQFFFAVMLTSVIPAAVIAQGADDPLTPWRQGVNVKPISPELERHTVHSYFNTCPESPDGKYVLFFASTTPDAHLGDVWIRERATGAERVLAKNIGVEDAHRVACQQWVSDGKRVVFHGERDGVWSVYSVDLESGIERLLAKDRLSSWGQPNADIVPLYGPYWNPGAHRNLELLNVASGEISTVLTVDDIKVAYPEWLSKAYGETPVSIFFPFISPDRKRVLFKMATAGNGKPRGTSGASRDGLLCYDLEAKKFLFRHDRWGHPAWFPDAKQIVQSGNLILDSNTGNGKKIPGLPGFGAGHPSASPDGKLFVTDTTMERLGGDAKDWGIVLANTEGTDYVVLHKFDNSKGATSWRRSHPHPVFSADGKRIYFNVSSGKWTQLYVAEIGGAK